MYVHYKKIQAKYYQTEYLSRGAIKFKKKSNVQKKHKPIKNVTKI